VDLRDFVRLLRRRWRTVTAVAVAGLAAACVITLATTVIYQASTEVFVSLRSTGGDSSTAYQDNLFSQQRVKSYVKIANSPSVTQPVVAQLDLAMTGRELAGKITAEAPANTVLIDIRVRDTQPGRARDMANAVATQFAAVVGKLESPGPRSPSPVIVTVVRPAELPTSPVAPRPLVNVALGLLVGTAAGVALAVLREILDTSVKTSEDLQELTGNSALGVIAFDPQAHKTPLVSQADLQSMRLEAFRTLRTNLRFVDVDHPPRVVVLTSSVAGEGKSTTACNLALTLASAGTSVIVVEGDLRRPRVADYMGLEGAVGLTDVLIGRASLDDVLQPWGSSPLSVLTSGALPPNPSEMLSSTQMTELIANLRGRADMVLIDAPPLLPVTDGAVLTRECDGALLVVRQGRTTREQLTRSLEALRSVGGRVLGTVLNMAPTGRVGGYGYGYGYYSGDYASRSDRPRLISVETPSGHADRQRHRTRAG
jgi:capsular exopolysaccharide synthesis family protein